METVEMLRQYLEGYCGPVQIDATGRAPGSVGLFPLGREAEALPGGLTRLRLRCLLRRRAPAGESSARWLLELEAFLRTAPGPALGEGSTLTLTKGRLAGVGDTLGLYEAELTATWLERRPTQGFSYQINGRDLPSGQVEVTCKPRQLCRDGAGILHRLPVGDSCRWVLRYDRLPRQDYQALLALLPREGALLLTHPDPCHPEAVTVSRGQLTEFCPGAAVDGLYRDITLVIET